METCAKLEERASSMSHRFIIAFIGLVIITAVVSGVVYFEWPKQSAAPTGEHGTTSPRPVLTPASTTFPRFLPSPTIGPSPSEAGEPALGILGTPSVKPSIIIAGTPTEVTVTIPIPDPGLVPNSVNLQRLDATGKVVGVLGSLHDDGLDGDAVVGDKTFTIRTTLTEPVAGDVRLQVSAAFRGLLRRVASAVFSIAVVPFVDPEHVLDELITHLRTDDRASALQKMSLSSTKQEQFLAASKDALDRLADCIASRKLIKVNANLRLYICPWVDDDGNERDLEILLDRDLRGGWTVINW